MGGLGFCGGRGRCWRGFCGRRRGCLRGLVGRRRLGGWRLRGGLGFRRRSGSCWFGLVGRRLLLVGRCLRWRLIAGCGRLLRVDADASGRHQKYSACSNENQQAEPCGGLCERQETETRFRVRHGGAFKGHFSKFLYPQCEKQSPGRVTRRLRLAVRVLPDLIPV